MQVKQANFVLPSLITAFLCVAACSTAPPALDDDAIRRTFEESQARMSIDGAAGRVPTSEEIEAGQKLPPCYWWQPGGCSLPKEKLANENQCKEPVGPWEGTKTGALVGYAIGNVYLVL